MKQYHKKKSGRNTKSASRSSAIGNFSTELYFPVILKRPPGRGFKHILNIKNILIFISLLPEWNHISKGLKTIVLASGEEGADGWYDGSAIGINAWERGLWRYLPSDYYFEHRHIFELLNIECQKQGKEYLCKFNEQSAKSFQLLHVFLHELGHHYDKMTTRTKRESARGESFAEEYAHKYEAIIWKNYFDMIHI